VPEFRRVSEEELFRAKVFRVDRFRVQDPEGAEFDRFVVRHPGAVSVVPLHADGSVTLVRQYRAAVDELVLEIPAGLLDRPDEQPEQAARRELAEEAGLEGSSWQELIRTWNTPGISDQQSTIFLATGLTPCAPRPDGAEERFMSIERIMLTELDSLVAEGRLRDETTVLGLYLARARLTATGRPA
jgi:ADP-ribose pyrophosphatase